MSQVIISIARRQAYWFPVSSRR